MIVTLDGQRVDEAFGSQCTLQTLLDRVRNDRLGDRLIVSVAVNGERLDDNQLRSQLEVPFADGAQLDLESGDRLELVGDALRGLANEFGRANDEYGRLPDQFAGGAVNEAVQGIGEFVKLWQTCYRAITQCSALLGDDLTLYTHQDRSVREWLEELVEKLTELRQALDAHDLVLLADLLRYELLPQCETWHKLLEDVATQVPSTHQAA